MTVPSILVFRWVSVPNPVSTHAKLLAFQDGGGLGMVYVGNAEFHANLAEVIRDEVGDATLFAAGDVNKGADVTSWKSSGFSFETPESMRESIAELLRLHATEIQDWWVR